MRQGSFKLDAHLHPAKRGRVSTRDHTHCLEKNGFRVDVLIAAAAVYKMIYAPKGSTQEMDTQVWLTSLSHTHTLSLSLTYTHSLSHTLSHSHSHTLTHSHTGVGEEAEEQPVVGLPARGGGHRDLRVHERGPFIPKHL